MDQAEPPTLPADPLLDIVERSNDVTTIIRCAATSKPLRRVILDPGFRRRLAVRAAANGGFDPDLLLAVSYPPRACYCQCHNNHGLGGSIVQPPTWRLRFDADRLLRSFNPASSRDGLVVLRRYKEAPGTVELLVCNTITGHATSLPRINFPAITGRDATPYMYRPALLSTGGGGGSFDLLVMYRPKHRPNYMPPPQRGEAQIFSSLTGEWGAAREIHLPPGLVLVEASSTAPAIVGSSVHWLCQDKRAQQACRDSDVFILSLNASEAGDGQATAMKLPEELVASMASGFCSWDRVAHGLILAATAERTRLSLVVAERPAISLWTLLPDEGSGSSWSREVVVRRRDIGRQLNDPLDAYQPIRFEVFGERSGTVLFWVRRAGLVQLNLGTKKAVVLWKDDIDKGEYHYLGAKAFLHEVDLVSLLKCMKPF